MKRAFSLSRGGSFPEYVRIRGEKYGVNADFRKILMIFRALEDDSLLLWHKYELLCRFFYVGRRPGIEEGVSAFAGFVSGAGGAEGGERQFDFELDAPEIYQSFYMQYNIDLTEIPFLHFYKFLLLLSGLGRDTPFIEKLRLRFMDLSGLKGAELVRSRALKERVQLPVKYTREELAEIEEFERVWNVVRGR